MARSRTSSLAAQVAQLRALVEAHVERTRPHCCVQVIFDDGTPDDEIERLKLEAAAEEGVDPDQVTLWICRRIVKPKPCIEPPWEQTTAPLAELADNVTGEPRKPFERKPDAVVIDERSTPARTEQPERPMPIEYPPSGVA